MIDYSTQQLVFRYDSVAEKAIGVLLISRVDVSTDAGLYVFSVFEDTPSILLKGVVDTS